MERRLRKMYFDLHRMRLDTYLVPLMAFMAFLTLRQYLDFSYQTSALRERPLRKKNHEEDNHKDEPSIFERQIYNKHGIYITDNDIDFQTDVAGCHKSSRPMEVQQRARHGTKATNFDAVFLVSTAVQNVMRRRAMRKVYGDFQNTLPYKIKVVFLVGLSRDRLATAQIRNESLEYGDLLQGNFVDHYFNLSYKTIMGYRWAQTYCHGVKLICKLDDDVYVDVYKFFNYFLPIISIRSRVIYGYLNSKAKVHRKGKYWVGQDEFSGKSYPQFCNGFFVVATHDVIADIYEVSKTIRFFRLEDVFTYGMVRQAMLDVQLVHLDVVTHYIYKYKECVTDHKYRCKYLAAETSLDQMQEYHSLAIEHRRMLGLPGRPD